MLEEDEYDEIANRIIRIEVNRWKQDRRKKKSTKNILEAIWMGKRYIDEDMVSHKKELRRKA